MAIMVFYNPQILVAGVDLSNMGKKAKVNFGNETKEITSFGDVAKHYVNGLSTPSADVDFYINRVSGSTVQTLRNLLGVATTAFTLSIRALNSAGTTSNEIYSMNAVINGGIDVINGGVGDVETMSVKFQCASGTGWTVSTTS